MCHFDRHHRKPRSIGGTSEIRNLSHIPRDHHEAWNLLFKNWTPEQIVARINDWFLDPDYVMLAVKKSDRRIIEEGVLYHHNVKL